MRRNLWVLVGSALLCLAAVLFLTVGSSPAATWFAYNPLSGDPREFALSGLLVSRGRLVACLVGVVGLVVVATSLGYRAGRRSGSARD